MELVKALEHWAEMFQMGYLSDDYAEEIAEILMQKAQELKLNETSI